MFILDDVLCWLPLKGVMWVAGKLQNLAEQEMDNEAPLMEGIVENELAFEEGRIDKATYEENQAALMLALRRIKERKRGQVGPKQPISGKAKIEVEADFGGYGQRDDRR